ncbi:MAG: transposase [Bacteroidales bacterium]|jgi:transposase|nr:transposase [Bacteroidales bacterium]
MDRLALRQSGVVLGLLVSRDGYPLSYFIFNGSQYEGRTMIPIVEDFVHRFQLDNFVIVADSELMTKTNMALLESANYKYIIGARIKNETEEIKQWILSLDKTEGHFYELGKLPRSRLIIGYSEKRAKKDKYKLDAKQVYEQYRGLWVIERAYRVTKGTLEIRPMFHFTQKRIEAHVCVCFVAYKEIEPLFDKNFWKAF